jgi:hypothetical protein
MTRIDRWHDFRLYVVSVTSTSTGTRMVASCRARRRASLAVLRHRTVKKFSFGCASARLAALQITVSDEMAHATGEH